MTALLLLHPPAAQHRNLVVLVRELPRPELEIAERDADDVAQPGVVIGVAELENIRLAGIVNDALLEAFDREHLHLDDEPAARCRRTLDVHNRELALRQRHVLLEREVLDLPDASRPLELQQIVEKSDEQRFTRFVAEDPLEDNVGLGVGEDGEHGPEGLRPAAAGGNRCRVARRRGSG